MEDQEGRKRKKDTEKNNKPRDANLSEMNELSSKPQQAATLLYFYIPFVDFSSVLYISTVYTYVYILYIYAVYICVYIPYFFYLFLVGFLHGFLPYSRILPPPLN